MKIKLKSLIFSTWNVRGLNAPNKQRLFKRNLSIMRADVVIIQVTKLKTEEWGCLKRKIGIWSVEHNHICGVVGGMVVLWDPRRVKYEPLANHTHWQSGRISCLQNNTSFILINIYGPISTNSKRYVWGELDTFMLQDTEQNYILGGDFNTISSLTEKIGGEQTITRARIDFSNWIHRNNLLDIRMNNGTFTWNNRRLGPSYIAKKLDRFMFKGDLTTFQYTLQSNILTLSGSDHFPLLLDLGIERKPKKCQV